MLTNTKKPIATRKNGVFRKMLVSWSLFWIFQLLKVTNMTNIHKKWPNGP